MSSLDSPAPMWNGAFRPLASSSATPAVTRCSRSARPRPSRCTRCRPRPGPRPAQLAGRRLTWPGRSGAAGAGTGPGPAPRRRRGIQPGTRSGWRTRSLSSTGRVAGRHQHAELEPGLVLLRRPGGRGTAGSPRTGSRPPPGGRGRGAQGPVSWRCSAFGARSPAASPPVLASSAASVASQVGSAWLVLNRSSSSRVRRLSLIQALFGKCASTASRQTLTGSR